MSTTHAERIYELSAVVKQMSRPSLRMRALIAERAGINVTDAECIDYLLDLGHVHAKDLAQAMRLSKSTVSAMLDRLERAGFIIRETDKNDRRHAIVKPNMKRIRERITPFYAAYGTQFQQLAAQYSDAELRFLTAHYKDVINLYEQQIESILSAS